MSFELAFFFMGLTHVSTKQATLSTSLKTFVTYLHGHLSFFVTEKAWPPPTQITPILILF